MRIFFPYLFMSLLFTSLTYTTFAQDIITLRTGDEIKAIVSEIKADVITYKNYDNPGGTLFTIEKAKVFMIKYEDGAKEVFEISTLQESSKTGSVIPVEKGLLTYKKYGMVMENLELLTPDEVIAKYSNNPEALKTYTKGRRLIKTGSILGGAGLVVSLGVGLLIKEPSMATLGTAVLFSSTALISSIVTTVSGRKKIKKSVGIYNSGVESTIP